MKSRVVLAAVLATAMWTSTGAAAQSAAARQKERCATRLPSAEELAQLEQRVSRARDKVKAAVTIPVWVHVINKGSGFANGDVPASMIRSQIRVLADSFAGRTGGAASTFDFELVGVTRTTHPTWFASVATDFEVQLEAKRSLRRGDGGTLNIYTVDGGPYLGFAYYPTILGSAEFAVLDGVVVDWRTLPGGTFDIYSEGDTATHEVGHWLALLHTFDGKCSVKNDLVADTPAEFAPAFLCPIGRDTCTGASRPGVDPIFNFMDYSQDSCMFEFSPGQVQRMQAAWGAFRASE